MRISVPCFMLWACAASAAKVFTTQGYLNNSCQVYVPTGVFSTTSPPPTTSPVRSSTTSAPASTTKATTPGSTTKAPGVSTTTQAPGASTTTQAPGASTTTQASTAAPTPTTPESLFTTGPVDTTDAGSAAVNATEDGSGSSGVDMNLVTIIGACVVVPLGMGVAYAYRNVWTGDLAEAAKPEDKKDDPPPEVKVVATAAFMRVRLSEHAVWEEMAKRRLQYIP